jgi:hypothetical protein
LLIDIETELGKPEGALEVFEEFVVRKKAAGEDGLEPPSAEGTGLSEEDCGCTEMQVIDRLELEGKLLFGMLLFFLR